MYIVCFEWMRTGSGKGQSQISASSSLQKFCVAGMLFNTCWDWEGKVFPFIINYFFKDKNWDPG